MPSKRLRRTLDHPDVKHGTYVTYMNYKCKCDACVSDYKRYKSEYRERNRTKIAAQQRAYYEKHHERLNEISRKRSTSTERRLHRKASKFGISVERLEELLAINQCAICSTNDPGPHGFHIDHDHACCPDTKKKLCGNCVRGILCHKCNVGLGHFDDDVHRMQLAVNYLKNSSLS
jgi:hypothetical protein